MMIDHLKKIKYVPLHYIAFQLHDHIIVTKIHGTGHQIIVPKNCIRIRPVKIDTVVHIAELLIHISSCNDIISLD